MSCFAVIPRTTSNRLRITSIEPWNILVGAARLAS